MAVTIREMREADLEAITAAAERSGVAVSRGRMARGLSLVAYAAGGGEGEDASAGVLGAVLCMREGVRASLAVVFSGEPEPTLARRLVDKALVKVAAAGLRTCHIRIHGDLPVERNPLSTGGDWFARFEREHAA